MDVDLYVETNVLRYLQRALRDPAPPAKRAPDTAAAADWVAATQLFLYAPMRGWRLWVSDTVHQGSGEVADGVMVWQWVLVLAGGFGSDQV